MLILLALACTEDEPPLCESYPTEPTPADGVLENADSCGFWTIPVGDQLIISVAMTVPDERCDATPGDGLELPYEATYTNFSDDSPKMTFQVLGEEPIDLTDLSIACTEGTEWAAQVQVTED